MLVCINKRQFGPKAAKPAVKGAAPSASTPTESVPVVQRTVLEKLVDSGQEFILGPPPGVNKVHQGPRDMVVPKIAPRIEVYAKKLRDMYIREGTISEQKSIITPLRYRLPDDSFEKLSKAHLIPGKILYSNITHY